MGVLHTAGLLRIVQLSWLRVPLHLKWKRLFVLHPVPVFTHPTPKCSGQSDEETFSTGCGKNKPLQFTNCNLYEFCCYWFATAERLHDMVSVLWIKFKWTEKTINNTSLFGVIKMWNEEKCHPAAWGRSIFWIYVDIVNVDGRINKNTKQYPGNSYTAFSLVGWEFVGAVCKW